MRDWFGDCDALTRSQHSQEEDLKNSEPIIKNEWSTRILEKIVENALEIRKNYKII